MLDWCDQMFSNIISHVFSWNTAYPPSALSVVPFLETEQTRYWQKTLSLRSTYSTSRTERWKNLQASNCCCPAYVVLPQYRQHEGHGYGSWRSQLFPNQDRGIHPHPHSDCDHLIAIIGSLLFSARTWDGWTRWGRSAISTNHTRPLQRQRRHSHDSSLPTTCIHHSV